ncbi:MAG: hypothetical protein R3B70_41165 [Polyangiaceae bacterium]
MHRALVLPVEVSAPEVLVDERAALVDGARVFVDRARGRSLFGRRGESRS